MMYDYRMIEEEFSRLLKSLQGIFTESGTSEVQQFLDAGEYGVALETLCGIVTQEHRSVGVEVVDHVQRLRDMMDFHSDIVTQFLGSQ